MCTGYGPGLTPGDLPPTSRNSVLHYYDPEVFPQVTLTGFFSFRNFVDPCVGWKTMCSCLGSHPMFPSTIPPLSSVEILVFVFLFQILKFETSKKQSRAR